MGYLRSYSIGIDRVVSLRIIILSLIVFMINNLLGIAVLTSYIIVNKSKDKSEYIMLFCLLSVFLGMINAGKMLESDLASYSQQFHLCGKISIFEFLALRVKEPIFSAFTYVTYYLTFGNFSLYVIICSIIIYFLLYYSLYKYYLWLDKPELILYAVFCATFFFPFFSLSVHILRQTIAASFLLYYMVNYVFYGKNRIWALICAAFFHSSTLFFIPFIFLKFFKKRITVKELLFIVPITIFLAKFYTVIFGFLTKLTAGIPAISYIFSRLSRKISEKTGEDSLVSMLVFMLLVGIAIYVIYFKSYVNKRIIHFYNIFLILCAFVLLIKDQELLSLRFNFYTYSFLSFIIFYPVNLNNRLLKIPLVLFLGMLMLMFVMGLENGVWTYQPVSSIVRYNIVDLFMK